MVEKLNKNGKKSVWGRDYWVPISYWRLNNLHIIKHSSCEQKVENAQDRYTDLARPFLHSQLQFYQV